MALDHYVSQVHLKNFYSPELGRLHAIRKSDLKKFEPRSRDVCRLEEGNTNPFLRENRAIEEFLLSVEPQYSRSIDLLRKNACDQAAVFAIAGFVSYILACSPTGQRLFSNPLEASVRSTAKILEAQGKLSAPPKELGYASFSEMLDSGAIKIDVDPKFPQAMSITAILSWVSVFGNSRWEVLTNDNRDASFFTSDFPVGFESADDPRVINKIVPLSPVLAVRIMPDISLSQAAIDLTFAKLRTRMRRVARAEAIEINRTLVRCAEDVVFFRDDLQWVPSFVAKNRAYRVEGTTDQLPSGRGYLNISRQHVVKRSPETGMSAADV